MKKISLKEFRQLPNDSQLKRDLVKENPEYVLHISEKDKLSFDEDVRKLLYIAIESEPTIIEKFEDFGIQTNLNMISYAKKLSQQVNLPLNKKDLLKQLELDINFINNIPLDALNGYLYNDCKKILKRKISINSSDFEKLPAVLQMRYEMIEAYALANKKNFYKLTNKQLNVNNGKILFKLIASDVNNINKISPVLLKQSLVRKALKIDGAIYQDLDEKYKQDSYNQYLAAKNLILTGRKDLCLKLFKTNEIEYINSKLMRVKSKSIKSIKGLKLKLQLKEKEFNALDEYFKQ